MATAAIRHWTHSRSDLNSSAPGADSTRSTKWCSPVLGAQLVWLRQETGRSAQVLKSICFVIILNHNPDVQLNDKIYWLAGCLQSVVIT